MSDAPLSPYDDPDPAAFQALLPADILPVATPFVTLDELREALAARIGELLDRRPELLMSILYRIDVAEAAVHEAIGSSLPGQLADALATLVIERQAQKLHWRRTDGRRNPDSDTPL